MGKSKKDQAITKIVESLEFWGIECRNKIGFASDLVDAMEIMVGKAKKKDEKTEGAQVWEAFAEAYKKRYQVEPVRNATVNNQAAQIARRVGVEAGVEIVQFFLNQPDAFYSRSMHQIGLCLKDCEMLSARMRSGKHITRKAADKIESASATLGASSSYLNKKYGQSPQTPGGENK